MLEFLICFLKYKDNRQNRALKYNNNNNKKTEEGRARSIPKIQIPGKHGVHKEQEPSSDNQ